MHLSKDKKIYIYFFLLIFLGSINNKFLKNNQIFSIKNLKLNGLENSEKNNLLNQLNHIKNKNIFSISREKIDNILISNNLIDTYSVSKKYPSDLNINIKKTSFLAIIKFENEDFLIGSNKRLIKSELKSYDLPIVLGNPTIEDFFLFKKIILESTISFDEIKKFYFFKSKRWDIEFKNGILVKLPNLNSIDALNNYFKIKNLPKFDNVKIFDMRIDQQIIINEL